MLAIIGLLAAPARPALAQADAEQAVIIRFNYGRADLAPVFALEDKLEDAIEGAKAGEMDGTDMAPGNVTGELTLLGPSADRLLEIALPILQATDFMRGATARKRYGPPGAQEKVVPIGVKP